MEPRKIIRLEYEGERDTNGLPHGEGRLEYFVDEEHIPFPQYPDLREYYREVGRMVYKGHFEHGVRQGKGYLAELMLRPASPYEWYSEGEYDCGHLIRPEHPDGSYREGVCTKFWYFRFEGTWEDDMPFKPRYPEQTLNEEDLRYIRRTCKAELEKTLDFTSIL
jgi:hypothetical protein